MAHEMWHQFWRHVGAARSDDLIILVVFLILFVKVKHYPNNALELSPVHNYMQIAQTTLLTCRRNRRKACCKKGKRWRPDKSIHIDTKRRRSEPLCERYNPMLSLPCHVHKRVFGVFSLHVCQIFWQASSCLPLLH